MFWTVLGALVTFVFLLAVPVPTIVGLIGFAVFGWIGAVIGFVVGLAVVSG